MEEPHSSGAVASTTDTTTDTTADTTTTNTIADTAADTTTASPTNNPMFSTNLPPIPSTTRHLLETYSHIPPAQVDAHILAFRAAAWAIHPYPCIGQFRFLDLAISQTPFYAALLARLQRSDGDGDGASETLLDMGCCLGQDVRRLVADGAAAEQIVACDLRPEFWELGYDFFGDRATLGARFVAADVFDESEAAGEGLRGLAGRVDMVHASSFVHLFDYAQQTRACVRLVGLLRRGAGKVIFGRQIGCLTPGPLEKGERAGRQGSGRYRHDPASFEKFWMEVSRLTGVKLRVECMWDPVPIGELTEERKTWAGMGIRRLRFAVWTLDA